MISTRRLALFATMLTLLFGLLPAGAAADVYFPGAYGLPDLGWSTINPRPVSETLLTVAYGAGRYVAVSEHNIYSSPDGEQWSRTAPFQSQAMHLVRIIYTGDRFLLTDGTDGWLSADGVTWAPTPGMTDLAVGPQGCVAVIKERLAVAADCESWRNTEMNEPFRRVSYANGTFYAAAGWESTLYRSADGTAWEVSDLRVWTPEIAYADEQTLIMLDDGAVWTSQDGGAVWSVPKGMRGEAVGAGAGGAGLILLQQDGQVLTSADGQTWTPLARLPGSAWADMAYGPNGYVAVGATGAIAKSADGSHWDAVRQGPAFGWRSVAYGAGRFLAIGETEGGGLLYRSENGLDWEYVSRILAYSGTLAVGYLGGQFLVFYDLQGIQPSNQAPHVLMISEDGVEWGAVPDLLKDAEVISRSGALLAITQNGLLVAKEGEPPRTLTLPGNMTVKAGTLTEDGRFVLAGRDGLVAVSADGQTWSTSQIPAKCNLGGLAAGNGRFITHCNPGEVFISTDGITWELVPEVRVYRVQYAGDKFFAIGGEKIAISSDGKSWDRRYQHPGPWAIAYGEGRYVGLGQAGLMLTSDGKSASGSVTGSVIGAVVPDTGRSTIAADALETVGQQIIVTVSLVDEAGRPLPAGRPVRLWYRVWYDESQMRLTDSAGRARFVLYFVPEASDGVTYWAEDVLSGRVLDGTVTLRKQTCGNRFPDVAAAGELCTAVESVAARGLMGGFPDGTFRGGELLTRAQLAKIAVLAAGQKPTPGQALPFSDTEGHWAARDGYLQAAVATGAMQGDPAGTFRPDDPVTRAELIKVIVALSGVKPEATGAGEWYTPWVETAYKYRFIGSGIFADVYPASEPLQPNQPATRLEAAAMLANLHRHQASTP